MLRKLFIIETIILIGLVLVILTNINSYDYKWIQNFVNITYIIVNIQYFWLFKRKNLLCFEFFFAISFWFCCFLSPFVIANLEGYFTMILNYGELLISKGYLICALGYLFYLLGISVIKTKKRITTGSSASHHRKNFNIHFIKLLNKYLGWLCILFFILFFAFGGVSVLTMYDINAANGDVESRFDGFGSYMNYLAITLNIATVTNFIPLCLKGHDNSLKAIFTSLDLKYLIILIVMTVFYLISGYRSGALQLILPFLIIFTYAHHVSNIQILGGLIFGIILLTSIGFIRSNSIKDRDSLQNMDIISSTRDFVAANGAVMFYLNHTDSHEPTYGSNILLPTVAIIPFAQSAVTSFIDPKDLAPVSSAFYTDYYKFDFGLGTNMIADLYYTFGLPGVIILMYLFGTIVAYSYKRQNIYWQSIYFILCGNSLFAPRVEYFYILRSIGFALIIIFIVHLFYKEFSLRHYKYKITHEQNI